MKRPSPQSILDASARAVYAVGAYPEMALHGVNAATNAALCATAAATAPVSVPMFAAAGAAGGAVAGGALGAALPVAMLGMAPVMLLTPAGLATPAVVGSAVFGAPFIVSGMVAQGALYGAVTGASVVPKFVRASAAEALDSARKAVDAWTQTGVAYSQRYSP